LNHGNPHVNVRNKYYEKLPDQTKAFDVFLACSHENLQELLNSMLIIDSENTVCFLMLSWLLKDEQRRGYFRQVIDKLQFHYMMKPFLSYVIPHLKVVFQLSEDEASYLLEKRDRALEQINTEGDGARLNPAHLLRTLIPNALSVDIRCCFQNVSAWQQDAKMYSTPILVHGYEIYYFVQRSLISCTTEGVARYGLGGFLRISNPFMPEQHVLPISYTVIVETRRDAGHVLHRYFPVKVLFEHTNKAVGHRLLPVNETWQDVISGNSILVDQNAITLTLCIEFLTSEENCLNVMNMHVAK